MDDETFGPYRIEELIGQGGMGEVHRAYDTVRNRLVALKRLPAVLGTDGSFRARFRAEAALVSMLTEPHIIPVHDFGEIDGRLYIDMRLVEGEDLATLLARTGPLPASRAVSIVAQVASALDAAHSEFLVHRDIKPANLLLTAPDTSNEFVYVADFGIARAVSGGSTSLTATGTTVGSLDYMAPERFGDGHGDHRVDVYALGCLLFEMLTARKPFPVEGLPAIINAHLNTSPPRPSDHVDGLPDGLDDVVSRAMAKDPDDRYVSAGALAAAAAAAAAGDGAASAGPAASGVGSVAPTTATAIPMAPRDLAASAPPAAPRRQRGRGGLALLAAVAAVLAIMGGATIALGLGEPAGASEIEREPVRTPGDNPFMPPVGDDRRGVTPPARSGGQFDGATPGIYGGTRNNAACDPEQMSAYLKANPEKAAAWAQVHGISPDRIPAYVARLTPVILRSDTAVTNHGFSGGRATPFPAVLQAGTAVLVDERGVPRTKCYCGNPLSPPSTQTGAGYRGPTWSGFTPAAVTTVTPAASRLTEFTLVDPSTNEVFLREVGGRGDGDRAASETTPDATTPDSTTPFTPGTPTPGQVPPPVESDVPAPPAAPSGLTATAVGPDTVELTWTDNSTGDTFFEVSNGVNGRSVPDSRSRYVWGGLDPGSRTCFRVTAYNTTGASAPSNEACATTDALPVALADLSPTEITPDIASPSTGSRVQFESGIRNSGEVTTRTFAIKWFVDGREVGAYGGHDGLPAESVVYDGNSGFIWTFDSPGTYQVTFTVDADDHVTESDEGNNSRTTSITVS